MQPLAPPAQRDISSKHPHQIGPYWHEKHKYLCERNWFDLIKNIKTTIDTNEPSNALVESLYQTLCNASSAAGAKLRRHPHAPYSNEIYRLRIIVRLHKLIISQLRTGYNMGDLIGEALESKFQKRCTAQLYCITLIRKNYVQPSKRRKRTNICKKAI